MEGNLNGAEKIRFAIENRWLDEGDIMRRELLEEITVLVGLTYISDLPKGYAALTDADFELLLSMNYSLKNWNGAVSYIMDSQMTFDSAEDAVNYLKEKRK